MSDRALRWIALTLLALCWWGLLSLHYPWSHKQSDPICTTDTECEEMFGPDE